MLVKIPLLSFLIFGMTYPLFFWVSAKDPIKHNFHRFHLACPVVMAGLAIFGLWLLPTDQSLRYFATTWLVVALFVTGLFWKKPGVHVWAGLLDVAERRRPECAGVVEDPGDLRAAEIFWGHVDPALRDPGVVELLIGQQRSVVAFAAQAAADEDLESTLRLIADRGRITAQVAIERRGSRAELGLVGGERPRSAQVQFVIAARRRAEFVSESLVVGAHDVGDDRLRAVQRRAANHRQLEEGHEVRIAAVPRERREIRGVDDGGCIALGPARTVRARVQSLVYEPAIGSVAARARDLARLADRSERAFTVGDDRTGEAFVEEQLLARPGGPAVLATGLPELVEPERLRKVPFVLGERAVDQRLRTTHDATHPE